MCDAALPKRRIILYIYIAKMDTNEYFSAFIESFKKNILKIAFKKLRTNDRKICV